MTRISTLIGILCVVFVGNISNAQVGSFVDSDGFIVITGSEPELIGVEFMSDGGNLIPVPNNDPVPFQFLLKNEPTHITYASLTEGFDVHLDGELKLSAGFDISAEFDLVGRWGARGQGSDGPISFRNPPIVPEPGSIALMLTAIMSLGVFRRSRRSR